MGTRRTRAQSRRRTAPVLRSGGGPSGRMEHRHPVQQAQPTGGIGAVIGDDQDFIRWPGLRLQGPDGIRDPGCLVVRSDERNDPRLRTAVHRHRRRERMQRGPLPGPRGGVPCQLGTRYRCLVPVGRMWYWTQLVRWVHLAPSTPSHSQAHVDRSPGKSVADPGNVSPRPASLLARGDQPTVLLRRTDGPPMCRRPLRGKTETSSPCGRQPSRQGRRSLLASLKHPW
jgi:hypothetical protein